jgi:hypothetical protein
MVMAMRGSASSMRSKSSGLIASPRKACLQKPWQRDGGLVEEGEVTEEVALAEHGFPVSEFHTGPSFFDDE